MRGSSWCACSVLLTCVAAVSAAVSAGDSPDLEVVHRIKQEAFKHSQVMEHLFHMTEVHGPRLTNSPGLDAAAQWVVDTLDEWGLANAAVEEWGSFGRGWSTSYFSAHLIEPQYAPLIGVPLAWTPGTDGVVTGTPILAELKDVDGYDRREVELERFMSEWKGKLAGKIVLLSGPKALEPQTEAPSKRFDDGELSKRARARDPLEPIEIDFENPDRRQSAFQTAYAGARGQQTRRRCVGARSGQRTVRHHGARPTRRGLVSVQASGRDACGRV